MRTQAYKETSSSSSRFSGNNEFQVRRGSHAEQNQITTRCQSCWTRIPIQNYSQHSSICEAKQNKVKERSTSRQRPKIFTSDRQQNQMIHRVNSEAGFFNRENVTRENNLQSEQSRSKNGSRNDSNKSRTENIKRLANNKYLKVISIQNSPRNFPVLPQAEIQQQFIQQNQRTERTQTEENERQRGSFNSLRQQPSQQTRNHNFETKFSNGINIRIPPRPERMQIIQPETPRVVFQRPRNQQQRTQQLPRFQLPRINSNQRSEQRRMNEQSRNSSTTGASQQFNAFSRPNLSQPRTQNISNQLPERILREDPRLFTFGPNLHTQVPQRTRSDQRPRRKSLTVSKINRLPKVNFEPTRQKYSDQCTICCEDFRKDEEVVKFDTCKHCFHFDCIAPCLKLDDRCPNCRQEVKVPKKKV